MAGAIEILRQPPGLSDDAAGVVQAWGKRGKGPYDPVPTRGQHCGQQPGDDGAGLLDCQIWGT